MTEIKSNGWGGKRPGAGRPRKAEPKNAAYEAAEYYQPGRHYIYSPSGDAKFELRENDRRELLRKGWWLYNNIGFARRAIDGIARHTCGTGMLPQARSADPDWNEEVEQHFRDTVATTSWAFDVGAGVNFCEAQAMVLRHVGVAGDMFGQFALSTNRQAMMRFLPGEHVGTGITKTDERWHDGVKCDPNTYRPLKYRVLKDPNGEKFTDVDASDMMHFRRVHRYGYTRGPSWLAPAAAHLQDMAEMTSFTKGSFKLASQIGIIVLGGDLKAGLGSSILNATDAANGLGVDVDKVYPGAGVANIRNGQDIKTLTNPHPGTSFEPFMNYLARDIAWGVGVSPEVLWNITAAGGANTRFVLADAQTYFSDLRNWLISVFCRPFYKFWLWHEMEAGRLPMRDDWYRHEWTEPADVTVDFGRDMKTMLEIASKGGVSYDRIAKMLGFDGEAEDERIINTRVRREVLLRKKAKEAGLELAYDQVFRDEVEQPEVEKPDPADV